MLTIDRASYDAIVAHARRDAPDEACGLVVGPSYDEPRRVVPMANAERSPTFYRFDPAEQLRVWRELDERDEVPAVIYHSHTATDAYPSRTDVAYAGEPDAHYVVVAAWGPEVEFRSFRIVDQRVREEEVRVVATLETA